MPRYFLTQTGKSRESHQKKLKMLIKYYFRYFKTYFKVSKMYFEVEFSIFIIKYEKNYFYLWKKLGFIKDV